MYIVWLLLFFFFVRRRTQEGVGGGDMTRLLLVSMLTCVYVQIYCILELILINDMSFCCECVCVKMCVCIEAYISSRACVT